MGCSKHKLDQGFTLPLLRYVRLTDRPPIGSKDVKRTLCSVLVWVKVTKCALSGVTLFFFGQFKTNVPIARRGDNVFPPAYTRSQRRRGRTYWCPCGGCTSSQSFTICCTRLQQPHIYALSMQKTAIAHDTTTRLQSCKW